MSPELESYYLENFQIIELSNCWYYCALHDNTKGFVGRNSKWSNILSISVPTRFFKTHRKNVAYDPSSFIDDYYIARPDDFIDTTYESGSLYHEIKKFKEENPNYVELMNFHFTATYFSDFDSTHYVSRIKLGVILNNNTVENVQLGNMTKESSDIMAKMIFDDVKYLQENINNDFIHKVYLKWLNA